MPTNGNMALEKKDSMIKYFILQYHNPPFYTSVTSITLVSCIDNVIDAGPALDQHELNLLVVINTWRRIILSPTFCVKTNVA